MMICGGAGGAPDVTAPTGRTSSWAMRVLLEIVLAALWPTYSVVILGQVGARTNRCRKRHGDKERGRQGDSQPKRLREKSIRRIFLPSYLLNCSPDCHNWPPAGKVDAFNY